MRMVDRAGRERKLSEKLRNVDSTALAEAAARQLDALEDDNHAFEQEAQLRQDDDEFMPMGVDSDDDEDAAVFTKAVKKRRASNTKAGKRGKGARGERSKRQKGSGLPSKGSSSGGASSIERWNMSLANMLQRDPISSDQRLPNMVHFDAMTARPSKRPCRPFCAVCGYTAAYTCRQCGARFCSIACNVVHQQAQCLKFIS